jgi:lipopolysaccharide transport system ATP-binding protein
MQDLPGYVHDLSLSILGGGHIIHFNRVMARGYHPTDERIPHPLGFWWVPAIACRSAGIPVALNAVSVDPWQPRWADPLMAAFVDSLDYVAVRDVQSQRQLARFASGDTEIRLIPDSVHSVSDLITRGAHSEEFKRFLSDLGLGERYVIVQPTSGLRHYEEIVDGMISDATSRGLDVLELPIFFELMDAIGYYDRLPAVKRARDWPAPLLLAELIANAESVIGLSLHLSIVASAYGIPVHRPSYAPTSKFVELDGLPNLVFLESSTKLTLRDPKHIDLTEVERRKGLLDEHWRRVYALASIRQGPRQIKGWEQIQLTPDLFRRAAGVRDRWQAFRVEMNRRGHFGVDAFRNRPIRS